MTSPAQLYYQNPYLQTAYKYIAEENLDSLDSFIEDYHDQLHKLDSELYEDYNGFERLLREIILLMIEKHEKGSELANNWLPSFFPSYLHDFDDQDFIYAFFANNPTFGDLVDRFKISVYQTKAVMPHLADCELDYASHSNPNKGIIIPALESFARLTYLGKTIAKVYQAPSGKFSNFTLATLSVVCKNQDPNRPYYHVVEIPIKDLSQNFASVKSYSSCSRDPNIADRIQNFYFHGVEIAKRNNHAFAEHLPPDYIKKACMEDSQYELNHYHSERALFLYLESENAIRYILDELKKRNISNTKIYAAVLNVYTTQSSCQVCALSSLGIQSKAYPSFFSMLETALKINGFTLPTRHRTKLGEKKRPTKWKESPMYEKVPGLKTAVRYVASSHYRNDRIQISRKRYDAVMEWAERNAPLIPLRKNIKTDTPTTILSIFSKETSIPLDKLKTFTIFSSSTLTFELQTRVLQRLHINV